MVWCGGSRQHLVMHKRWLKTREKLKGTAAQSNLHLNWRLLVLLLLIYFYKCLNETTLFALYTPSPTPPPLSLNPYLAGHQLVFVMEAF